VQQFNETQEKAERLRNHKAKPSPLLTFRKRYEVGDEALSDDGLEACLRLVKTCKRAQLSSNLGVPKQISKILGLTSDTK
jgi:hypothetical protein